MTYTKFPSGTGGGNVTAPIDLTNNAVVTAGPANTVLAGGASNSWATVLVLGTNPAGTGDIRLPHSATLRFRNNTNELDVQALTVTGTEVFVGGSNVGGIQLVNAATGTLMNIQTASTALTPLNLNFTTTLAGPVAIQHNSKASGSGAAMSLQAQSVTAGSGNGGTLVLRGGASAGGQAGSVFMEIGNQDSLLVATNLSAGQRQTGVNWTSMGTVQMPANTGDLVTGVGDAATIPSADAVGGHIYYSDGGKPGWRFNSTNLRMNGTSNSANTTIGGLTLPLLAARYVDVQINGTQVKMPYYAA